jgi:hypothetical protein
LVDWTVITQSQDPQGTLYSRLLGPSWLQLAEPIRFAHTTHWTVRAHGRLRIEHGRTHLARFLARLLRLPRATEAAETRLVITPRGDGEHWLRTFDDRCLATLQYEAGGGELAERFGVLEFRFRLEASERSLLYRQVEAAFRVGSIRLRLPALCTPRVDAREDPAGARRISVLVRVALPVAGPVLGYDGTIDIEDTHA